MVMVSADTACRLLGCCQGHHLPGHVLQENPPGKPDSGSTGFPQTLGERRIQMNKAMFNRLVESVKQAGKIHRGEMAPSRRFEVTPLDIKKIRETLRKSQTEFAAIIGVSVATLRNWEQGRRHPIGPARALLKVVSENPKAVLKALAA